MTHWNHRVVKKEYPESAEAYTEYSIREVFYNEDGSIYAYTENPMETCGGSLEELREYLMRCLKALDQPILVDGEVVFNDGGDSESEMTVSHNMEEFKRAMEEDEDEDAII